MYLFFQFYSSIVIEIEFTWCRSPMSINADPHPLQRIGGSLFCFAKTVSSIEDLTSGVVCSTICSDTLVALSLFLIDEFESVWDNSSLDEHEQIRDSSSQTLSWVWYCFILFSFGGSFWSGAFVVSRETLVWVNLFDSSPTRLDVDVPDCTWIIVGFKLASTSVCLVETIGFSVWISTFTTWTKYSKFWSIVVDGDGIHPWQLLHLFPENRKNNYNLWNTRERKRK